MFEAAFNEAYPVARRAAQVHAAKAGSVPYSDRVDLVQEGLLAFWCALPKFDPSRASLRTFAVKVVANQVASVIRGQRALRRTPVAISMSPHSPDAGAALNLRVDVAGVIAVLSCADRRLAQLLAEYSPSETCRLLHKSRSTVYEGMGRLRHAFSAAGIGPGLYTQKVKTPGPFRQLGFESRQLTEGE